MAEQPQTQSDLIEALRLMQDTQNHPEDSSAYRYVLYARKSTDDKEKQVRSLGDQILECRQLAESQGLNIVKVIKESESAKEPDIRPKFREMIAGIVSGKYDGIIAWHPDRLARNMKDAGELIDLLDKSEVRDLRFVSFSFQNTTSGKMLLGIAFVLSKQYSDQLSDNVKRGIKRSIEEGKYINTPKHGYKKDKNQLLRPDGENFVLIKKAFLMRLEGKTLEEIANFLNDNNYCRAGKSGTKSKPYKMNKKRVSEFLRDPIYAGVLLYGDSIVNLVSTYDFIQMISVEQYAQINKSSKIKKSFRLVRGARKDEEIRANLLRQRVICGECSVPMSSGITTKKTTKRQINYYYYRCDTTGCSTKSIRARVVIHFVLHFLNDHKLTSKESYGVYKKEMESLLKKREKEDRRIVDSLKRQIQHKESKMESTKNLLIEEADAEMKAIFKDDLKSLQKDIKKHQAQKNNVEKRINKTQEAVLSFPDFLELFEKLPQLIEKTTSMEELDYIVKKIFSNFTIKNGKVAEYTLNSPFRELVENAEIRDCRSDRT